MPDPQLHPSPPFPFTPMASSSAPSPTFAMPDLGGFYIQLGPPPLFPSPMSYSSSPSPSSAMPYLQLLSAPSPSSAMTDLQLRPPPPFPFAPMSRPAPPPRTMSYSSSPSSAMPYLQLLSAPSPSSAMTDLQLRPPPPFPFTPMSRPAPPPLTMPSSSAPTPSSAMPEPWLRLPWSFAITPMSLHVPPPRTMLPLPPHLLSPKPPALFTSMSSSSAPSRSSTVPGLPPLRVRNPEILLEPNCFIGDCQYSNSAKTDSSQGLSVEVSFQICDPPALSHCFARCYDLTGSQRLAGEPVIIAASGGLALLDINFSGDGIHPPYGDYFSYRTGTGSPSLHLLPRPYPTDYQLNMVAVLPICDDSEDYAVVFPVVEFFMLEDRNQYTLHIYRSDRKAWCTQVACIAEDRETQDNKISKLLVHEATSAVYAGTGLIGWIDLYLGVVICNVLDKKPTIRFVPLPPIDCRLKFNENTNLRPYRHMTIYNGLIKFIELKFHSGPAFNMKRRDDQGWMATTWTRPISSDVWHEGLTIDTSDILVTAPSFRNLLPEILNDENKLDWVKLMTGGPTLSLNDNHTVYILAKMSLFNPTAFVLTLNTRSLTIESCAPCCGENMLGFEPTYAPFALFS